MNETVIRVKRLTLNNIKNVGHGEIDIAKDISSDFDEEHADILGIYGQNGSGKTAVIDALSFIKNMLSGKMAAENPDYYIKDGQNFLNCEAEFYINLEDDKYICIYSFELERIENTKSKVLIRVKHEKLSYKKNEDGKRVSIEYNAENTMPIMTPKARYDEFVKNDKNREIDMVVAKRIIEKETRSFLFSDEIINMAVDAEIFMLYTILTKLRFYAMHNLFVIQNSHSGVITLNLLMPISFKHEKDGVITQGDFAISLSSASIYTVENFELLKKIIENLNVVISAIIPGMILKIHEFGMEMTPDGREGVRFELMSVRNDTVIPLRYESEGIKKIFSILNLLIGIYSNEGACVAIDELDAGIFEYLLGEILAIIEERGKGQLIFTSHNLRPLEMIHKTSLIFTTTNENNRYIHLKNVKKNNNLRDLYIRAINLGGQNETIYEPTNSFEISRAFRKAGYGLGDEK